MLGFDGLVKDHPWAWGQDEMTPGTPLSQPQPLFEKLDEDLIEKEVAKLGN